MIFSIWQNVSEVRFCARKPPLRVEDMSLETRDMAQEKRHSIASLIADLLAASLPDDGSALCA